MRGVSHILEKLYYSPYYAPGRMCTVRFWVALRGLLGSSARGNEASHPGREGDVPRSLRALRRLLRVLEAKEVPDAKKEIPNIEHRGLRANARILRL